MKKGQGGGKKEIVTVFPLKKSFKNKKKSQKLALEVKPVS